MEPKEILIADLANETRTAREEGKKITREHIASRAAEELGLGTDMPVIAHLTEQVVAAALEGTEGLENEVNLTLTSEDLTVHSPSDERESLNTGNGLEGKDNFDIER